MQQRQTRTDAFKAFLLKDWQQTEDLAAQVVEANTSDQEARGWLESARKALGAAALYNALRELKDENNWQAVLEGMEVYEREYPGAKDDEKVKKWAQEQQWIQTLYDEARQAMKESDWRTAIERMSMVSLSNPQFPDSENVTKWAEAKQLHEMLYSTALNARRANDWRRASKALQQMDAQFQSYDDPKQIKSYVERAQRRDELYSKVIDALEALIKEFPEQDVKETFVLMQLMKDDEHANT